MQGCSRQMNSESFDSVWVLLALVSMCAASAMLAGEVRVWAARMLWRVAALASDQWKWRYLVA
jgi:hypothetical protein